MLIWYKQTHKLEKNLTLRKQQGSKVVECFSIKNIWVDCNSKESLECQERCGSCGANPLQVVTHHRKTLVKNIWISCKYNAVFKLRFAVEKAISLSTSDRQMTSICLRFVLAVRIVLFISIASRQVSSQIKTFVKLAAQDWRIPMTAKSESGWNVASVLSEVSEIFADTE